MQNANGGRGAMAQKLIRKRLVGVQEYLRNVGRFDLGRGNLDRLNPHLKAGVFQRPFTLRKKLLKYRCFPGHWGTDICIT